MVSKKAQLILQRKPKNWTNLRLAKKSTVSWKFFIVGVESVKIANTVLLQANLVPLSYLIQPVYWDYSECLNLNTVPDFLVLADTWAQYTIDDKEDFETIVANPGNFSCSKTFSIIYPHLAKVEESSLSNNMES